MIQILESSAVRQAAMPMTVEQYHRLSEAGIVVERTELLRGVVVEKMTKSPLHFRVVQLLVTWLTGNVPSDCYVRQEGSLTLADSEPEPDIAVVQGGLDDHRFAHPSTAEFVVEVAITSLELDRQKAAIYAAAGVPEYWIVIPDEQVIEVYTSPTAEGYQQVRRHDDAGAPLATTVFPDLAITPRELFA